MDISRYQIEISRHAFIRALQRGIDPDAIEDVLQNGKIERYGKQGIKFVQRGSKRTLICIGELVNERIKIFTIEEGN